jgi:hypothetical protein
MAQPGGGDLMAARFLARYPLFRLLSAPQLDDWIAAGQEIACATGETEGRHRRQRLDLTIQDKDRQEVLKDLGADPFVD